MGGEEALLVGAGGGRGGGRDEAAQLGVGGAVPVPAEQPAEVRDRGGVLVAAGDGGVQPLADLHEGVEVKLVGVALPVHLLHDVLVVVVAQGSRHFVVVHVWFGFSLTPASCNLVRVTENK